MASMTITIPDGILSRVLDGIANQFHYDALADGTKAAFAKQQVIAFILNTVRNAEVQAAASSAGVTAASNVNSQVTIT